eukprot:snap_masked-scaffold_23-processed-gene-0.18-mRNA-1 protein AED:1.00 eAED:1.00 QI:0/0/0/0/1/1/2/0/59
MEIVRIKEIVKNPKKFLSMCEGVITGLKSSEGWTEMGDKVFEADFKNVGIGNWKELIKR